MNPGDLLRSVVPPPKPKTVKKPATKPEIRFYADLREELKERPIKGTPWNQCPKCKTMLAYQLILPSSVHVRQSDGSVKLVRMGEATYECKFCHYEKSAIIL